MDNDAGYSTSSRDVAEGVYEFIQQFFILFPEFASAPFYLGGGSYGGNWCWFCLYINVFTPVIFM